MEFWFKKLEDMTDEERMKLPIGPIIQCKRDWTYAEIVAGQSFGATKGWSEILETLYEPITPQTSLWDLVDKRGQKWKFRQFKNGAWFREPVFF